MSAHDVDMERKYDIIHKKYKELQNYRIDSVIKDTEDLRQKIEEHRRIHELVVTELQEQNKDLRRMIQEARYKEEELKRIRNSNADRSKKLQMQDSVLHVFLKQPEFRVRITGRSCYEIHYGENDDLIFTLTPASQSGSLLFQAMKYPPGLARNLRCTEENMANRGLSFPASKLADFCTSLLQALRACRL